MTAAELHADTLKGNGDLVLMTLKDFSDSDMLVRPCDGGNHANWQIGHLVSVEASALKQMGGTAPELPAGFAERYTKNTAANDDPSQFAKKDELVSLFTKVRNATAEFARNTKPEDLAKPGPERLRQLAPTVGHTILLSLTHTGMHLGQIQSLRRKLGKPVLF